MHAACLDIHTGILFQDNVSDTVEIRRARQGGSDIYSELELLVNGTVRARLSDLAIGGRLDFGGVDVQKLERVNEERAPNLPFQLFSVQFSSGYGFQVGTY